MAESKNSTECLICLENVSNKKICSCGFCEYKACVGCTKRSILYQSTDPTCPGCSHSWSMEFCYENFGKSWMTKDYRKHKKDLLFDIEKSKIPNTMPAVERIIKIEKCKKELDEKKAHIQELENLLFIARCQLNNIGNEYDNLKNTSIQKNKEEAYNYKCPKEGCEGFLNNKFICPMCDSHVCKKCFEIKEIIKTAAETKSEEKITYNHTCDKNSIESFKLIKKDTKPCPNCSERISKISGCDQMWCTQCHVTFSWTTGLKVTGNIHNPHYYEWKRNNAETTDLRNVGEILCGGIPDVGVLTSLEVSTHNMHWLTIQEGNNCRVLKFKNSNYKGFDTSIIRREDVLGVINEKFTYIPIFSSKKLSILKGSVAFFCENELNNIKEPYCDIKRNAYISISKQRYFISNLLKLHRAISHFSNYELHWLRVAVRDIDEKDETMRIKYIMKKVDEKHYKTLIMKKHNRKQKLIKILHVFEMCNVTILETFNNIIRTCIDIANEYDNHSKILFDKNITEEFKQDYHANTYMNWFKDLIDVKRQMVIDNYNRINTIVNYCNKELWKISKLFNQNVPFIHYGVLFKEINNDIVYNKPGYLQTISIRWDNEIFQLYETRDNGKTHKRQKVTGPVQDKHFEKCWLFDNHDNYELFQRASRDKSTIYYTKYEYRYFIGINELFESNEKIIDLNTSEEKKNIVFRNSLGEFGRGSTLF